jgi:HD superfamily phosphodiesterase
MLDLDLVWQRAEECFAELPGANMRAHAEAVLARTRELLALGEPGDAAIILPAAVLHDVGIPRACRLHPNAGATGQEVEGAVLARDLLFELGASPAEIETISGIVGIHHHRPQHATDEFRIVYDADLLVNLAAAAEPKCDPARDFYTASGVKLAEELLRARDQ